MPQLEWPHELDTGVPMLDSQHHALHLLCHKLAVAYRENLHHDVVVGICLELKKFADFHFLCEENLMRGIDYPAREDHAGTHARLIFELDLWAQRVYARRDTPDALLTVLRRWIMKHVGEDDHRLAQYLEQSGSRPAADAELGLYRRW